MVWATPARVPGTGTPPDLVYDMARFVNEIARDFTPHHFHSQAAVMAPGFHGGRCHSGAIAQYTGVLRPLQPSLEVLLCSVWYSSPSRFVESVVDVYFEHASGVVQDVHGG